MTNAHVHNDRRDGAAWPGSRLAAMIEIGTLLALAAFLVGTWWTGRVRLFVAPVYVWLPPAAGMLLVAMTLARLSGLRRGEAHCGCGHPHGGPSGVRRVVYAVVVLIPVGLALSVNPQHFSADGVRKRTAPASVRDRPLEQAMAWILGQKRPAQSVATAAAAVALPAEPTVRDLLAAVEQGEQDALTGRFLTLVGQCSPWSDGDSRRFDLYRMLVTCCIADAQAISIEVVSPTAAPLDYGQWVRIGGVIRFDGSGGPTQPVLHAAKIEKIPLPSRPYL
jgi:uncharacterized repeat protein (TIGR03943 family)